MYAGLLRWLMGGVLVSSALLLGTRDALAQGGPGGVPGGCGRGSGQQNVPAWALARLPRIVIGIYDDQFLPAQISVQPGTIVIWRNFGSQPHTTTSWGHWGSRVMFPGDRCATWFVTAGTYDYLSIVAADGGRLTGSITVEGPPIGGGTAGGGIRPSVAPIPPQWIEAWEPVPLGWDQAYTLEGPWEPVSGIYECRAIVTHWTGGTWLSGPWDYRTEGSECRFRASYGP
jgi:hypothetical protein